MTPDAQLRMEVYQAGQRAFNSGGVCPYSSTDWRAKTWAKGRAAAAAYHLEQLKEPETVPCGVCSEPTPMLGTKRCDRCYELELRIRRNPELARQILDAL